MERQCAAPEGGSVGLQFSGSSPGKGARLLAGIQEQQATVDLKKRTVLKRLEQLEQEKQDNDLIISPESSQYVFTVVATQNIAFNVNVHEVTVFYCYRS